MALIDVSDLLTDPDFADTVTLITRASTVNSYGEHVITETETEIVAVVQGVDMETLAKLPDGARLSHMITVYYRGTLTAGRADGYSDIIVWRGKRYQVTEINEDFRNYGAGFTEALCTMEALSA